MFGYRAMNGPRERGMPQRYSVEAQSKRRQRLGARRLLHKIAGFAFLLLLTAGLTSGAFAQEAVPFEVSNPKHKKWSPEEAGKIYYSACDLLARTVRPEKPPHLHPKFVLVLGGDTNQVLRTGSAVEIHLKSWDAGKFAEAMVLVAAREVLQMDDLMKIARQSVSSAEATVSADRLRETQ